MDELLKSLRNSDSLRNTCPDCGAFSWEPHLSHCREKKISQIVDEAVRAEREACAKLVEEHDRECGEQDCIAADIRARN